MLSTDCDQLDCDVEDHCETEVRNPVIPLEQMDDTGRREPNACY